MKGTIEQVTAREILDSRGNPTVEVEIKVDGHPFRACVPSGASTGIHEALELRDTDEKTRYGGKGVEKAVANVKERIAPEVTGMSCLDQGTLDRKMIELDGTPNKSNFGANAILGVSMAAARGAAAVQRKPLYAHLAVLAGRKGVTLPAPQMNVINGGKHAGMENDIQEHMIVPIGAGDFKEALRMGTEVYHALQKLIKSEHGSRGTLLGDEGGFVPPIPTTRDRLKLMDKAIEVAGYKGKIAMALDPAASEFFDKKTHAYTVGERKMTSKDLVDFYDGLVDEFPIVSIEDGMAEDDWDGWGMITERLGGKIQIVGDDLLVTNPVRIRRAVAEHSANALLLKVNQIGTVTESIEADRVCRDAGWNVVVSHRSGETEDAFIADLAVALDCGQSKFGAPARTDRNAKYNELLRIEERLGTAAVFAGKTFQYRDRLSR